MALSPDDFAELVVGVIAKAIEPLKARNGELEARVPLLESRPLLKPAVVHVEGKFYNEGNL